MVELKGISARAFALSIGVSSQVFGKYLKDREPSYDTLRRIIETYDDISAEWLLTGKGEILKGDSLNIAKNDVKLWTVIESQQRTIEQNANTIAALTQQLAQKGDVAGAPGVAPTAARG